MAAGQGFKTFVTGDVLTAADTNGYLMQGVWVFASAAARDAAVTSPQEGNTCYLKDTDVIQCYSGSAWVQKSSSGAGSGLTLVKRASFSAVASTTTTFDSVFTSTYDNYVIVADKVYGSSSGAETKYTARSAMRGETIALSGRTNDFIMISGAASSPSASSRVDNRVITFIPPISVSLRIRLPERSTHCRDFTPGVELISTSNHFTSMVAP